MIKAVKIGKAKSCANLKKKVGTLPVSNAMVVRPKLSPGLNGSFEAITQSVIGIVMLNKTIPISENTAMLLPVIKRGMERVKAKTPTVFAPNLSPSIPPNALPKNEAKPGSKKENSLAFHAIGKSEPPYERIVIENRAKIITAAKGKLDAILKVHERMLSRF
ncbi:MAG: hypothetical protein WCN92_09355 [Eubacteriales bacterium]